MQWSFVDKYILQDVPQALCRTLYNSYFKAILGD